MMTTISPASCDRTKGVDPALAGFIAEGGSQGRTRTQISRGYFGGNANAARISAELAPLVRDGAVVEIKEATGARPIIRYIHRTAELTKFAGQDTDRVADSTLCDAPSGCASPAWPTWVGSWPRLTGRQEPADESAFDGDETDGDTAAQLAQRVGVRTLPWQWLSLRKILSRRPDGLWTHPDVVLICPRQGGKTLIVILRILFGLFVLNEQIVYSAQRWVTAESVYKRLKAIIERRPSLARRLAKDPTCSSSRAVIELKSGACVALGVRSGDLGRGLDRIDLVVFDEAYNLEEAEVASLIGSQLASPNSQTIYTSAPPVVEKHPNCGVLASMRRLGQSRQPGLYFAEWAAPEGMSRDDPQAWRLAMPSYGVIQQERDVRRIHDKAKTPAAQALFDADYLGWGSYPPDESDIAPVIPEDVWAQMATTAPELVGPVAIAVDRSPDRKQWAIAAAQRTAQGCVHIEIGPYDGPWSTTELVEKLLDIVTEWDPVALVIDQKSPAAVLKPYLVEAGVEPIMSNASELALACAGFLDATLAGHVSHCDQGVLNDAISAATKRDMPAGGFAWNKTHGSISQLMAATLAHWAVLAYGPAAVPKTFATPVMGTGKDDSERNGHEVDIMTAPF